MEEAEKLFIHPLDCLSAFGGKAMVFCKDGIKKITSAAMCSHNSGTIDSADLACSTHPIHQLKGYAKNLSLHLLLNPKVTKNLKIITPIAH